MKFLQMDKKQREYDGLWETLALVKDYDNAYVYNNDVGEKVTLVPNRWIAVRVTKNEPVLTA